MGLVISTPLPERCAASEPKFPAAVRVLPTAHGCSGASRRLRLPPVRRLQRLRRCLPADRGHRTDHERLSAHERADAPLRAGRRATRARQPRAVPRARTRPRALPPQRRRVRRDHWSLRGALAGGPQEPPAAVRGGARARPGTRWLAENASGRGGANGPPYGAWNATRPGRDRQGVRPGLRAGHPAQARDHPRPGGSRRRHRGQRPSSQSPGLADRNRSATDQKGRPPAATRSDASPPRTKARGGFHLRRR